jgi:CRP-like cAMP-binding protein
LPPRTLKAGEVLAATAHSGNVIYHLLAGWAFRFRSFSDGHQAIVDFYLPGEIIGLDGIFRTRPLEGVMTLTSTSVEAIDEEDALTGLMMCKPVALYIAWLLGQRQRRTDGLLAAISSLDARGRVATMVLDFYMRLSRQRLTTGSSFTLPLTQLQIGAYLGLTVAHVNRVLRSLRDERTVIFEKHSVTILNIERLRTLAQSGQIAAPMAGPCGRSLEETMPGKVGLREERSMPVTKPSDWRESFDRL